MALKSDWQTGEQFTADDANAVADAVNHTPFDLTVVQFADKTTRATGVGDLSAGVCLQRDMIVRSVRYRFVTPDASGSTTVELRVNGVAVSGTSLSVAAADQGSGGGVAREVSGLSVQVARGDVLTAHIVSTGTTPGKGLYVDVEGTTDA